MKATGMVRKVDELGRLVIPKEIRSLYDINVGIPVEFFTDNNRIVLAKYQPQYSCVFCNECDGITDYKGKRVCQACKKELAGLLDS